MKMRELPFFNEPIHINPMKSSPGKLKTFLQCPQKYNFLYVQKQKGNPISKANLNFDSFIKKHMEQYQNQLIQPQYDISKNALEQAVLSSWDRSKFDDTDNPDEFKTAALDAAKNMTTWFKNKAGHPLTYRRKPALGLFASFIANPITIWTRLDRVERLPNNDIRIVNFKSGAHETDVDLMKTELSVRLMAAAAKEYFGQQVNRFAYVYLRTGKTIDVDISDLNLDKLHDDILDLAKSIQREKLQPIPGPLCHLCEYIEICNAWKSLPWDTISEDRKTYNRRLRISYSKMSLFERCPRAYSKLYNEGIPPKPKPFFSFGSCIHAVMEDFYDDSIKTNRSLNFLLDLLEKKWPEFLAGYQDQEMARQYKRKAQTMLENYYTHFVKNTRFKPAFLIEQYFELPVGNDSIMTGFIDRIDKISSHKFEILDYKTELTKRTQQEVDDDLQLTLYYWAAGDFCKLEIESLGLFMMAHDELITTSRKPDDLPELFDRIERVTTAIRTEKEFPPKTNKYCRNCDHLESCPLKEP